MQLTENRKILHLIFLCLFFSIFWLNSLGSYVDHLPLAGETLRSTRYTNGFGGKGANQCVAASKLGSKTVLISKVTLTQNKTKSNINLREKKKTNNGFNQNESKINNTVG